MSKLRIGEFRHQFYWLRAIKQIEETYNGTEITYPDITSDTPILFGKLDRLSASKQTAYYGSTFNVTGCEITLRGYLTFIDPSDILQDVATGEQYRLTKPMPDLYTNETKIVCTQESPLNK